MSRIIPLTQNKFAIVDNVDYKWLKKFRWRCQKMYNASRSPLMYAVRQVRLSPPSNGYSGKRILFQMHREILGLQKGDGKQTDHIDGNGLNNQRSNLRICTQRQNLFNQRKRSQINKGSKFKGVYPYRYKNSIRGWWANITLNRKPIYLGSFKDEVEAAQAYNRAAAKLFGEFAKLNEIGD